MKDISLDKKTADAFALSWNNLPSGTIYTFEQFADWMSPLKEGDIKDKRVLELGCGNASLMMHLTKWIPSYIEGIDLGDSVLSARANMGMLNFVNQKVVQADLTKYRSLGFDLVYSIGVIHHLKNPKEGFEAVLRNTKAGGRFHVWVYAREGNNLIIYLLDPIRKLVSRFNWWIIKYLIATPLVLPFYFYSKIISLFPRYKFLRKLPLYDYSLWISKREFSFFRHVAFDQLVTPETAYISRETIESWLAEFKQIDRDSTYIIMRNGNSWKFGGRVK